MIAEIDNALWKSVLRGDVDKSDAYAALQIAVAHFERIVPIDQLAARALELAVDLRHPTTTVCILRSPSANGFQSLVRTRSSFQPASE